MRSWRTYIGACMLHSSFYPTFLLLHLFFLFLPFLFPPSPLPPYFFISPLLAHFLHLQFHCFPPLPSSTLPIQTLRCNSTVAALWPCPHHGHSGLPHGSSVCLPPPHPESCWPGGHAVPLGQDLHRLDLLRHLWKTSDH